MSYNIMKSILSATSIGLPIFLLSLQLGCKSPIAPANSSNLSNSSSVVPASLESLTAVPKASHPSASDKEIEKWAAKAKLQPKEDASWCNLGDAYMQKARETADVSYYSLAEKVYDQALTLKPNSSQALVGHAWVNGLSWSWPYFIS